MIDPEVWAAFQRSKRFEDSKTLDLATLRGRAGVCLTRAETTRYSRTKMKQLVADLDRPTVYDETVEHQGMDPLSKGAAVE